MTVKNQRSTFSGTFYVANTMEIFERLAWYGFFTLSSLYMTSPSAQGGLGFSDQERGFLQGMIPFLLYLFPVLTGAIADRYGYRRMFILSFAIMSPAYFLLGQVTEFWSFCGVFLAVAIGAACFKPIVVGTIGRVTDDSNRGLGFGIFYTMVNIGGFLGPLIAGYVRVIGWDMVFIMSALWIAINFIPAIFFYKEPTNITTNKSLQTVLKEVQQVLGNGRLALLVFPLIILLMVAAKGAINFNSALLLLIIWVASNLLWDRFLARQTDVKKFPLSTSDKTSNWYQQPIKLGNKPFIVYLVILTGFWTMYLQLFITTPLYIRDFINTQDLVCFITSTVPSWLPFLAAVNTEHLITFIEVKSALLVANNNVSAQQLYFELVNLKVMVPATEIINGLGLVQEKMISAAELAQQWTKDYRQINPEYIINLDFGIIILFQLLISNICAKLKALPVIVVGTLVVAIGLLLGGLAHGLLLGGTVITTAIIIFSFGEMIASPKSQEYVAAIAPQENTAMYMGYYFVSMALGNLFAGLLSGWGYGYLAKELNNPMLMWTMFASIGLLSALTLIVFKNRWLPKWQNEPSIAALPLEEN
jgi:MFS family permease